MNINVNLSLRVCCMLCFFLIKSSLFAQTSQEANEYNKVSIASPTAGSLAKFVDIPVSLHTGIPDINIPLYTISDGALSVPISMSYHASGLKVLEPAGWVGAGWALNAGGVITRSVRGTPDEKATVNGFQHYGFFSDYGYRNHLLSTGNSGVNARPDSGYIQQYDRFQSGEADSEPDLFFFNFGGYSGKFYFNDDRTPMLLPEQDIKIEYNYTYGSAKSIQGFTLTTPDGVKYYFGATPSTTDTDPVEYTKVYTNQNGMGWNQVISSWYLNKIVSADGNNTITLNYRAVNYSYYTISTGIEGSVGAPGYKLVRNYVFGVELDNITSSNGQVNFIAAAAAREDLSSDSPTGVEAVNTTAKALARIDILKRNGGILLKSFNFNYDYFVDNTGTLAASLNTVVNDKKRLKLISIQEKSGSGVLNPPFQFDYFSEPVPRRLSFAQDHWGFINGITTNGNNLIATFYNTNGTKATVTGADRDPRWPAMRGGTLQKITFPTGGYNIYDFEPNQFYTSTVTGNGGRTAVGPGWSVGYDGGQTTKTLSFPWTLGNYQYVFSVANGLYGGTGHLNVYNSNNVLMDHVDIPNNQRVEITRNYFPGTYTFEIIKDNAYSGNGVSLSLYQLTDVVTSTNAMVGGLRIKTITQSSGLGNPDMVTSYDYNDGPNSLSTGILFGKPTIAQVTRNDIDKNYWPDPTTSGMSIYPAGCPVAPGSVLRYITSATSVRPMNSSQGSHIGYKKVTVSQTGKGYSVSMFNTDGENGVTHDDIVNRNIVTTPNTCTTDIPNFPAAPDPNYFNRGQLIYKADYDASGTLLDDATITTDYQDNPMTTPAFVLVPDPAASGVPLFTWYDQKTGHKVKETVIRKNYNTNGTVTDTTKSYYESLYHHQVTRTLKTNSTGDTYETRYRYVPDFTLSNVDLLSDGLSNYNTDLSSATNTFNAQIAACTGSVSCQRPAWQDYDVKLSHARLSFVNYRITNFTGANNTYSTRLQNALGTVSADLKPIIGLRLQNNLQVIESTSYRNGKILGSVFNTFDYKPNSGNQIYLSKVSKTEFLIPQTTFAQAATGSDNVTLVKDGNYKEKAYFDYKAGNIAQVTPKDGVSTSYLWSYNNQYPVAKAVNAQSNEIMFNGFEESGSWDGSLTAYDNNFKHSGLASGRIDVSTSAGTSMSNTWLGITLTAAKMYHYAAWVYSNGPSANVVLFMKRAGETGYYSYIDFVTTTVTGKWVYVEKDFLVPADVTQLNMRVDNNGTANGGSQVWFDDVRVYPTGALMTSYTYDPQVGMTGMTDAKGISTNYEYDPFQRLQNVKDKDGNIVKHIDYHYQGQ